MTEPPRGPADPRPTTARDPKRTSERQIAANRENAKKSTGPRAAGKQRSSQNATKAGLWAQELRPISRGPFREDGDEFYARAEAQSTSLRPSGSCSTTWPSGQAVHLRGCAELTDSRKHYWTTSPTRRPSTRYFIPCT